jgi:hypothetical protein
MNRASRYRTRYLGGDQLKTVLEKPQKRGGYARYYNALGTFTTFRSHLLPEHAALRGSTRRAWSWEEGE